jgi:hypothetical protein
MPYKNNQTSQDFMRYFGKFVPSTLNQSEISQLETVLWQPVLSIALDQTISLYWDKKAEALIQFCKTLATRNNPTQHTKLFIEIENYINSRDYTLNGKSIKTSRLGFHWITSTDDFIHFKNSIASYTKSLNIKPVPNNIDYLMLIFKGLQNGISYFSKNPLSVLFAVAACNADIASAADDHLVAYYKFNGNALDSSKHKNHAIVHGAVPTIDIYGQENSAFYFTGSNSYMRSFAGYFPQGGDRTISILIKPEPRNESSFLFGYGGNRCGTSMIGVINNDAENPPPLFEVQAHCLVDHAYYQPVSSADFYNKWSYLTITVSIHNGTKIYLNGTLVASAPNATYSDTYVQGTEFGIGTAVDPLTGKAPFGYYLGAMDEVMVESRELTPDEIAERAKVRVSQPTNNTKNNLWGLTTGAISGTAFALITSAVLYRIDKKYRFFSAPIQNHVAPEEVEIHKINNAPAHH